jgi:hypothetical protein
MIKETIDATLSLTSVKKFPNLFLLDKIPQKKKDNIRSSYGKGIKPDEEILLILDDTVFGKADNGFAITEKGIYFHLTEPTGYKRRQDKISIDFILDPDLGGLKIEAEIEKSGAPQILVFNGIRMGKYILSDKLEFAFLNDLFKAFNKIKPKVSVEEVKGKEGKKANSGNTNNAKISIDSKFIYLQNGDQYFGEATGEKMNGYGIYCYNAASILERYVGNWKDGIYDGQGTLIFKSQERYIGEWKNGKRQGRGMNRWPDGMRYEGEFKENKMNGKGIFLWPDGMRYEGDWLDDKRHGKGFLIEASGQKYEGDWFDGIKQGKGIFIEVSGQKYEGTWINEKKDGKGIETYPVKDQQGRLSYNGEWKDDLKHGFGTQIWKNGEKYEGQWTSGYRTKGIMIFTDGSKYDGELLNAKRHGYGTQSDKKGAILYLGKWMDDVFVGAYNGTLSNEDGTYTGQINNQKKNGKGTMNYSKGKDGLIKSEGDWDNDKFIQGTFYFEEGATISGLFTDSYKYGKGKITHNNGDTFEGSWENLELPNATGGKVSLFSIPEIEEIIFAEEYINDKFQRRSVFEAQQVGDKLNIRSIDDDLDLLLKSEKCEEASKIIDGVRSSIKSQADTDEEIYTHLIKKEDSVKKLKNEILHRSILAKFGVATKPEPKIKQEEKPVDDFDDFA